MVILKLKWTHLTKNKMRKDLFYGLISFIFGLATIFFIALAINGYHGNVSQNALFMAIGFIILSLFLMIFYYHLSCNEFNKHLKN